MNDAKKPTATGKSQIPPAAGKDGTTPSAAPPTAKGAVAGDLDLAVEEIQRPELMKEGFVGQER